LATAAVPDLDVVRSRGYAEDGDYDSALIETRDGRELVVRVPTSQTAETEQSGDIIALGAMSPGVRGRLPFDIPDYLGQAPLSGTRAAVYTFLPGGPLDTDKVPAEGELARSIGAAIAAIHYQPAAVVGDAGLPVLSASDCRTSTLGLIENGVGTGLVPVALRERWRDAAGQSSIWQFQPTVINGSLSAESFLIDGESVTAVVGWSALRVGDPARDLQWMLAMNVEAVESALGSYGAARRVTTDHQFTQRALLYSELEVVRWLLHGKELHDQDIVDDAVGMLDGLVESVHAHTASELLHETGPVLGVSDVEALLDGTPLSVARADDSAGLEPVADKRDTGAVSDFDEDR
jgi:aminoglycoside phosphotransferase (APT) family kinase protein